MQGTPFAVLFAILAVANAGVLLAPSSRIIQGPSSRTTVVGPDGSSISSVSAAGQIVQEESVGVVAETAPIVAAAAPLAYAAPAVAYSAHALAYSAPLVSAAPLAYSAPVVSGLVSRSIVDSAISGPSGSIVTGRNVAEPVIAAAPVVSAW